MPKKEKVLFTRDALYELVWSRPVTSIAPEFGMSSNAFAKHCKKLNVPVPGHGYWTRVEHGFRPKAEALPPARAKAATSVSITKHAPRPSLPQIAPPVITHGRPFRKPHAAIVRLRELLRRHDGSDDGHISGSGHAVFSVSMESRRRALRILDALFKTLDRDGAQVNLTSATRGNRHALQVVLPNRPAIELWMSEHLKRTPHVLDDSDRKWGTIFARKYDYAHSGTLILECATPRTPHGLRRRWMDSPKTPLEQKLGDVVVGLHHAADALQEQNERWERQRREQEEERQRVAELERRRQRHEMLVADLREMAARWREAENLRAFIAVVAATQEPRAPKMEAWLAWARDHAEKIDPLQRPEVIPKDVSD